MRLSDRVGRPLFALLIACCASAPAVASITEVDVVLATNGAATVLLPSASASFTNTDHEQVIDASYADALGGLDSLSTNSASSTNSGDMATASFTTESALKLTTAASGTISFTGSTSASASGPEPAEGLAESTLLDGAYTFNTTSPEVVTLTYNSTASASLADAWTFTVSSGSSVLFTQSLSSTSSGRIIVDLPSAGQYELGVSLPASTFPDVAEVVTPPGGTAAGSASATFDFAIAPTAAPEPATWATMLIGFAGLGFAAYRRSRRSAPPPA